MDFIRKFFFDSSSNNRQQFNNYDNDDEFGRAPERPTGPRENDGRRGFHIFSDPLQMHRYFEHQMNETLKMFGFQGFDDGFFSDHYNMPSFGERKYEEETTEEQLRNQFLKNGFEKAPSKDFDKMDKDIDGKMNLGELDSILGRKNDSNPFKSDSHFFGQSKSIKTITNADGSIETHRIVRDNEGNEEVTICRKIADKEYCIIKKKDKLGKEEVIENFVNLDENEKDTFFKPKQDIPKIEDKANENFPFDIFFK